MSKEEAAYLRGFLAQLCHLLSKQLTPVILIATLAKWIDANEDKGC